MRRRSGTSKISYPLPELEPILEQTLGILVYQEQVMRIAQRVAGYSLAEADLLRKAIGKKKREIMVAEGEKFIRGCVEHGTPKKKAQELWALIEPFARYGFPKAHAVAYALVAYKTAYLKAHYPVDFLAATLSAEIGSTDGIVKVISDCVEMGISVLPPDINESRKNFTGVGGVDPLRPRGDQRGRESRRPRRSCEEREQGPLRLLHRFRLPPGLAARQQAHPRRAHRAGSLRLAREEPRHPRGRLGACRGPRRAGCAKRSSAASPLSSRGRREEGSLSLDGFPEAPEWSLDERLKGEKDVLGFYVTGHPLTRFTEEIDRFAEAKIAELPARVDRTVRLAGVLVNLKKQKIKKGVNEGKTMLKATLEDTTGSIPVCVFASLYEKRRVVGAHRPPGARHGRSRGNREPGSS